MRVLPLKMDGDRLCPKCLRPLHEHSREYSVASDPFTGTYICPMRGAYYTHKCDGCSKGFTEDPKHLNKDGTYDCIRCLNCNMPMTEAYDHMTDSGSGMEFVCPSKPNYLMNWINTK